jgi:choline dehydrogenase
MLPKTVDTLVIGGGSGGAALAGLIAERSNETVLLAEAGPDYGPLAMGRWPAEMLDARRLPASHDWGYHSGDLMGGRRLRFERARVIGGCSAHNGCSAVWGTRADYDGWAQLGLPGWSLEEVRPLLAAADRRLRVRRFRPEQVPPFQQASYDAMRAFGLPATDINDPEADIGVDFCPMNSHLGIRWNAAFGYLDPVRHRETLTVAGHALADRLLIEAGRVRGAVFRHEGGCVEVEAGRTVLAAGAYGSPAILLRSGIGDPDALRRLGIAPAHPLAGVGQNLQDHPAVAVRFAGTPALEQRSAAFEARGWYPDELVIAKASSGLYRDGFDLHLFPTGGRVADGVEEWSWAFFVASVRPRARGRLSLASADPEAMPAIDHRHLGDADQTDLAALVEGVAQVRAIAATPPLAALIGKETDDIGSGKAVADWVRRNLQHYWHPAGSCAMGPQPEQGAVVDGRGKLHGLEGCYVADASIMPAVTRANTNIPTVMIAERIARWME